ncbi:MAG: hypothetical protein GF308_06085 [Candidatus Heimdallarchaeota archaeon]|nr:hypothetical protein [Candidatus Heimdallarchaeota archaeon]
MSDRIISFDIIRGWAILGNLVVHAFMLMCTVQGTAETDPANLTGFGYVLMGFIVLFGHWRGLFLLISAAVHMYIMNLKLNKGISRQVILAQEMFKGIVLWLWAMFFYVFLAQWSISKEWVETGSVNLQWQDIYHADQFANIAWAIMISAVIFYILTANEKLKQPIVGVIVFAVIGCLFVFPAPIIHEAAMNFWGVDLHDELGHLQKIGDKGWWDYFLRMIGNQFTARESPLMPHFAYSATGSILGILISQEKPDKKKILGWGYGLAGFSIVFSVFWLFVVTGLPEDLTKLVDFHVHPTWFVFLSIGMLLMVVLSVMASLEFNPMVNWSRRLRLSRWSRRAGVLSLSVYSLASIQIFLRVGFWGIFQLFGWNDPGFRVGLGLPVGWTFLLIFLEQGIWFLLLWIWEKGRYIGSVDWIFALILKGPFMKKDVFKQKVFGDLLDVHGKIISPTPISWVIPIPSSEVEPSVKTIQKEEKISLNPINPE